MALKGFLIVDPECGQPCNDAVEAMKEQIGAEEIEVLEPSEAIRRGIDLGTPDGLPFVCVQSEATGKCLTKMYFHDEEGKLILQPYPTVYEGGQEAPAEGEGPVEGNQG